MNSLIPILEKMDLSDTLAPVVIEPEWAELCLHEFGLGYFSMLDASEEIFSGFLDIVLTKYISECLTAFNVSVGYLYGMPYKVDQTGVLMDAGKVILNPFSRDGRVVNQRYFQILTGYEGSYWEHNLFELWFRLPSISAIKALEIANVESIPIYMIDSTNVDSILPLLELPIELKEEIEDAVNIGFEVKIPKREIQFLDWIGAGYIIQDPETGTGAYRISGGYAGGGSGSGIVPNTGVRFFLWMLKRGATVALGCTAGLDEESDLLAEYARRKLLQMYYFAIIRVLNTINDLKRSLVRYYQFVSVYFFIGHTIPDLNGENRFLLANGTILNINQLRTIVNEVHPEPFKFVYILGCYSAQSNIWYEPDGGLLNCFPLECGLGVVGECLYIKERPDWVEFNETFWDEVVLGKTIQEAVDAVKARPDFPPGWKNAFYIKGDGSIRLWP